MILRLFLFLALCSASFAGVGPRVAVVGRGGGGIAIAGGGGGPWTGTAVQTVSFGTTGGAGTSFVFTWSTTPVTGNDIWLSVVSDTTISTPAGWTLDASNVFGQGQYIFHKVASSEPGTVTISLASGNITASGTAVWGIEYAGLPASSFDKTTLTNTSIGVTSTIAITPTATLSQAAELALCSVGWFAGGGTVSSHSFNTMAFSYSGQVISTGSTANVGNALGTLVVSATTGVGTTDNFTGSSTSGAQGLIGTYKHN